MCYKMSPQNVHTKNLAETELFRGSPGPCAGPLWALRRRRCLSVSILTPREVSALCRRKADRAQRAGLPDARAALSPLAPRGIGSYANHAVALTMWRAGFALVYALGPLGALPTPSMELKRDVRSHKLRVLCISKQAQDRRSCWQFEHPSDSGTGGNAHTLGKLLSGKQREDGVSMLSVMQLALVPVYRAFRAWANVTVRALGAFPAHGAVGNGGIGETRSELDAREGGVRSAPACRRLPATAS
jgi:hypothetical protein